MKSALKYGAAGVVALAGISLGAFSAVGGNGLDTWQSGKNHNKIIEIQNKSGDASAEGAVDVAFFSNSAFQITSPSGIKIMLDPWRNDPSGAWGLWYRLDFPKAEVDIGLSSHAHFDHDAIGALEANMILDRMAGSFMLGDVKITGIADKHQCVAPGTVAWTEAVKQFEGREVVCPPGNARHFDNNIYLIETGGMKFLSWGDNRPEVPQEVWDQIGDVDVVFVPVDGSRHILDYQQADSVVRKTGANIAIPHHYLVPETTFFTSTLEPADEWVKTHDNTYLNAPSVSITKDDLRGKSGHVYYFGSHNMVTDGS